MCTIKNVLLFASFALAMYLFCPSNVSADQYGSFNADGSYSYHGSQGSRYGAPQRPMGERDDRFYEERKRFENGQIERQNEAWSNKKPQASESRPSWQEQYWVYGPSGQARLCVPGYRGITVSCF